MLYSYLIQAARWLFCLQMECAIKYFCAEWYRTTSEMLSTTRTHLRDLLNPPEGALDY